MLIHSDEFKKEIGQSSKVKDLSGAYQPTTPSTLKAWSSYNGSNHARQTLLSSKITGHDKDEDCDGDCSNCQGEFNILDIHDNHHELDGEAKEEEEVEFKERDVDLYARISDLSDRGSS